MSTIKRLLLFTIFHFLCYDSTFSYNYSIRYIDVPLDHFRYASSIKHHQLINAIPASPQTQLSSSASSIMIRSGKSQARYSSTPATRVTSRLSHRTLVLCGMWHLNSRLWSFLQNTGTTVNPCPLATRHSLTWTTWVT